MGIPGLDRLIKNIKNSKIVNKKLNVKIDHFLIDFNGIVYTIYNSISDEYNNNNTIFEKINR